MIKSHALLSVFLVSSIGTCKSADLAPRPIEHNNHKAQEEAYKLGESRRELRRKKVDNSQTTPKFNLNEFKGKDPYELEERYNLLVKEKKFEEAAKSLIGAAINGDVDSMDYILNLDHQIMEYINSNNQAKIHEIILKIAEKSKKQFEVISNNPLPINISSFEDIKIDTHKKNDK